ESREAATWLRQHIWQPLEERLADAKTVLISPDGALGKLSFAALPGKEPSSYLIEEERLIAVIPSAAALPAWMGEATSRTPPKNLLVLGGVNYDSPAASTATPAANRPPRPFGHAQRRDSELQFDFLPATEGELAGI